MKAKRILSAAAALALALALFPALTPPAQAAVSGTLTIGSDMNLPLGVVQSGTGWAWEPSSATLTLDEDLNWADIYIDCAPNDVIYIAYTGDVESGKIICGGSLIIGGSGGTLEINTSSYAIFAAGGVTITGGDFEINGSIMGIVAEDGGVTIENGVFYIEANTVGIYAESGDIRIEGDNFEIYAGSAGIYAEEGSITITDGYFEIYGSSLGAGGLYAEGGVLIENGEFYIEGLRGIYTNSLDVKIEDGDIKIVSENDGIRANRKVIIDGGLLNIENAAGNGIAASNSDVEISGGRITVVSDTNPDSVGISALYNVIVSGGRLDVTAADDGISGGNRDVIINDGTFNIKAGDKGIAARRDILINGGGGTVKGGVAAAYAVRALATDDNVTVMGNDGTNGYVLDVIIKEHGFGSDTAYTFADKVAEHIALKDIEWTTDISTDCPCDSQSYNCNCDGACGCKTGACICINCPPQQRSSSPRQSAAATQTPI